MVGRNQNLSYKCWWFLKRQNRFDLDKYCSKICSGVKVTLDWYHGARHRGGIETLDFMVVWCWDSVWQGYSELEGSPAGIKAHSAKPPKY